MSGRKNHILPKFLLRGFNTNPSLKIEHNWVFQKGKKPYEASIEKIGAARDFYKRNGDDFIDSMMTKDEGIYGSSINSIRRNLTIPSNESATLNRMIIDLYTRSKNMTTEVEKSYRDLIDLTFSDKHKYIFIEKATQIAIAKIKRKGLGKLLKESIIEHGQKKSLSLLPIIRKEFLTFLESTTMRENIQRMIEPFIPIFKSKILETLPKALKTGQLDALDFRYRDDNTLTKLNFSHWSLFQSPDHDFILGDVGPIFSNDTDFNPLIWHENEYKYVYLPLSNKLLLIGKTTLQDTSFSISSINFVSSFFSNHFFVASRNSKDIENLSDNIGNSRNYLERLHKFIDTWFNEVAREAINKKSF